ncbi:MAG TPA: gamma-glutamyltransferase [Acidimicrobiales bacterium]|nr:gamma-glutamyltransferase [Acidimicrobiales bacterium]
MVSVPFATRHAPTGMVCSVDHLASEAGVAMLRAGGTAADAAIAANAVLAVTCQHLCGMGGDLFVLVHTGDGPPECLNASGRAGSGADAAAMRAEGLTSMPLFDDIRAVTVPGCVDGWLLLHARHGRLPLSDVLAPARDYAVDGFPASPSLAGSVARLASRPVMADYTEAGPLVAGGLVRRAGVARALDAVAVGDRAGFYEGEFGHELLALGRGLFTADDLARRQAEWVEPLGARAWGHDLWTVPPNSQGYLTLAAAWIADGLDLSGGPDDERWAHLLVEAARQVAFDRPAVLHDGADGPALLAPERLLPRRHAIGDTAADLGVAPIPGGTMALVAADGDGMGVSLIQSNAAGFGSNLAVPGLRIFLQNRGLGFSLQAGHPAELAPGRRPPHTLSPALVTAPDGSLAALLGTMGGDSQPQILLQLLARHLAAGESPGRTIAAGRFVLRGGTTGFDTWSDGGRVTIDIEDHAPAAWADGLRRRGHAVRVEAPWGGNFGHAHLIAPTASGWAGAADPRHATSATAAY